MGQAESTEEDIQSSIIQAQVSRQLSILKDIANLSYDDFVRCVESLNELTRRFMHSNGKQLMFIIKSRTDETFLWKGTVRINCIKVNIETNRVESSRVLSLRQFMLLNKEILDKSTLPVSDDGQLSRSESLTASIILQGAENIGSEESDAECVICMENPSQIILPCEHQFCEKCIDSWNVQQKTCPLCRNTSAKDDAWVLTERLPSEEYDSQVKGYIMGLADRSGHGGGGEGDV